MCCSQTGTHTHAYTLRFVCIYVCMQALMIYGCMPTCIVSMYTFTHIHTHRSMASYFKLQSVRGIKSNSEECSERTHIICVYVFICMCIHECMHACMHVFIYYVCMYVYLCMHVCMYHTHTHTHTHTHMDTYCMRDYRNVASGSLSRWCLSCSAPSDSSVHARNTPSLTPRISWCVTCMCVCVHTCISSVCAWNTPGFRPYTRTHKHTHTRIHITHTQLDAKNQLVQVMCVHIFAYMHICIHM